MNFTLSKYDHLIHDLEKPKATVKMFFDLYRTQGATTEQLIQWENLINQSFDTLAINCKKYIDEDGSK